jgi:hypothetical protein
MDVTFRGPSVDTSSEPQEFKPVKLTDAGNHDKALSHAPEFSSQSELERWETENGKYGLEYLGIKEIAKEFPYSADFSVVDNYLKETLKERGYDQTPERWQDVLREIEDEIGSKNLNAIDRLKKIAGYVKVAKKMNELKKLKDSYRNFSPGEKL